MQELLRLREDFEVFDVCVARMIDRGCEHFGRARSDGRTQLGDNVCSSTNGQTAEAVGPAAPHSTLEKGAGRSSSSSSSRSRPPNAKHAKAMTRARVAAAAPGPCR